MRESKFLYRWKHEQLKNYCFSLNCYFVKITLLFQKASKGIVAIPFILWIQDSFPNRMATRFVGFDGLNGIKSSLQNFIDTCLPFYDMQYFQKRVRLEPIHPITKKLQGCRLVEATVFQL